MLKLRSPTPSETNQFVRTALGSVIGTTSVQRTWSLTLVIAVTMQGTLPHFSCTWSQWLVPTNSCYLSHALKRAISERRIPDTEEIRTLYTRGVLRGLKRKHDVEHPARESTRVPLSFALVLTAVQVVDECIGNADDRLSLKAALALAYGRGLSLRPGEYLKMNGDSQRANHEQSLAKHAYLWWDGKAYSVTEPETFPNRPAQHFTLRFDFLKQDQTGKGMPRAVSQPIANDGFTCVSAIEKYARNRKLKPEEPLIMMGGAQMRWDVLRCTLQQQSQL